MIENTKKKRVIFLTLILSIIVTITILYKSNATSINSSISSDIKAISLEEAYTVTLEEAQNWNGQARLFSINSIGKTKNENIEGLDGKRRFWNVVYAVPNIRKQIIYTVHDGKIIEKIETPDINAENSFIDFDKVKINSKDALVNTKKELNLQPGKGWAKGYHFAIRNHGNKIILSVVGEDENGYFSKVYFNATTGELIVGEHKVPYGGQLYKGKDRIVLSSNEKMWIVQAEISPNYNEDNTIIVQGVIHPLTSKSYPSLFITNNSGKDWRELKFDKHVNKFIFSPNFKVDNTIYAITENIIFVSENKGTEWEAFFNTSKPIKNAEIRSNNQVVLTENLLYISYYNGQTWSTIEAPKDVQTARLDIEGNLYILSNNVISRWVSNSWVDIKIPFKKSIKNFKIDENLICYSSNEVGIYTKESDRWNVVNNFSDDIEIDYVNLDSYFNKIYVFCKNDKIFRLNEGGDSIEGINLNEIIKGSKISFIFGPEKNLFFVTSATSTWEEIKKRN